MEKNSRLIQISESIMARTRDPIHDVEHARRVVANTHKLGQELKLPINQQKVLELAAYWHDVSRTLNRRPSFIIMPFFDDLISALMMFGYIFRYWQITGVALGAAKVIMCKSLGTGAVFTRLLMWKKDRILINLLKDADTLDMLHQDRLRQILALSEESTLYFFGYKTIVWWITRTHQLYMTTKAGRDYMIAQLKKFIEWLNGQQIFNWHVEMFGLVWVEMNMFKLEKVVEKLTMISAASA